MSTRYDNGYPVPDNIDVCTAIGRHPADITYDCIQEILEDAAFFEVLPEVLDYLNKYSSIFRLFRSEVQEKLEKLLQENANDSNKNATYQCVQ